jgi:hypothetical protein
VVNRISPIKKRRCFARHRRYRPLLLRDSDQMRSGLRWGASVRE